MKLTASELSEHARELSLLAEIVENRSIGNTDTMLGNGDEDLHAAVEDAEVAIRRLRADLGVPG